MALYKVNDPGWKPRKPSFNDSFKQALGGALGQALVKVPTSILGGLANNAMDTSFQQGGSGWEAMQSPADLANYRAKQEQEAALRGLNLDVGGVTLDASRRKEREAGQLTTGRMAAARAKLAGTTRVEEEATETRPYRYSQAATGARSAADTAGIQGKVLQEMEYQRNAPRLVAGEDGRKWKKGTRGDWVPYEEPAPKVVTVRSGRGGGLPSGDKYANGIVAALKGVAGASLVPVPNAAGGTDYKFVSPDAKNAEYNVRMARASQLLDQYMKANPEEAQALMANMGYFAGGGKAPSPGAGAIGGARGTAQGGRAASPIDANTGRTVTGAAKPGSKKPSRPPASLDTQIQRIDSELGKLQEQRFKAQTASEAGFLGAAARKAAGDEVKRIDADILKKQSQMEKLSKSYEPGTAPYPYQ